MQTFEFQIRARMPTTDIACTYTLSPFYFIFHSLSMQSLPIHMHMALAIIICIVRRMDRLYVADAITRFVHCSCSHVCCKLNGNQKFYTQAPIYTHTHRYSSYHLHPENCSDLSFDAAPAPTTTTTTKLCITHFFSTCNFLTIRSVCVCVCLQHRTVEMI